MNDWFDRAFQHEPANRHTSAPELATALAAALAGAPEVLGDVDGPDSTDALVTTSSAGASRAPRSTRRRWIAGLAGAAVIAGSAVLLRRAQGPLQPIASPTGAALSVAIPPPAPVTLPAERVPPPSSPPQGEPPPTVSAAVSDRAPASSSPAPVKHRRSQPPSASKRRPAESAATPTDDLFSDPKN
jgi:hypothetical protein